MFLLGLGFACGPLNASNSCAPTDLGLMLIACCAPVFVRLNSVTPSSFFSSWSIYIIRSSLATPSSLVVILLMPVEGSGASRDLFFASAVAEIVE